MEVRELGDVFAMKKVFDAKLSVFGTKGLAMVDEGDHNRVMQSIGQTMKPSGKSPSVNARKP